VIDFHATLGPRLVGVNEMDTKYDIFKRVGDAGPPLWIETVTSLEEAKQRMGALSSEECATYMVFDWRLARSLNC
jgi:hypothetical protein